MRFSLPLRVLTLTIFAVLAAGMYFVPLPMPVRLAALTAATLLFVLIDLRGAMCLLIVMMLWSPEFPITEVGARMVVVRVDDLLILLISGVVLIRHFMNPTGWRVHTGRLFPVFMIYIIICVVSTAIGVIQGRVQVLRGFFYVAKYFEYVMVYLLAVNLTYDEENATEYLLILVCTGASVCIYALIHLGMTARLSAPFEVYPEPNTLGGYLLIIIALCYALLTHLRGAAKQFALLVVLAMALPAFLYTLSRGSILAFFPMAICLIYMCPYRIFGAIVWIALIPFAIPMLPPEVIERFAIMKSEVGSMEIAGFSVGASGTGRIVGWIHAMKLVAQHPLLGVGTTGGYFIDGQYVLTLMESGMIGLVALFAIFFVSFRIIIVYRNVPLSPAIRAMMIGVFGATVGLLVHAFAASTFILIRVMEPFCFLLGMVSSMRYWQTPDDTIP